MSARPLTITAAAALQALVAAAIAAAGCYAFAGTVLGRAADAGSAVPLAVFALLAAAAAGYCAWGLFLLRDWARTPAVLTHVFVLVVAYYMFTSGQYAVSAVMAAAAAAGLALVFAPSTTATLFPDGGARHGGSDAGE
ncbi:hypothetical protein [Streptomonospora salina]|uniref:Small-conductance mechanosensitive channel n=1 Tax=Streptomonospora salina TaxID=104205 RepID=A0A841E4M7_9ACTN|nr:hypothetical protein [Streptomonospora salina]MBB5997722.1 small-conductance mechanosensitive channel [Streptomonospora salina]